MKIKILSSRRVILTGEAKEVILPGEGGELSILDFHQPCIVRLKAGRIIVRIQDIKEKTEHVQDVVILRGMAQVDLLGLSILVEEGEKRLA